MERTSLMRRVLRVVALGALVASATIAPGGASTSGRDGIPRFNHVFVVVMENLDYGPAMSTPGIARIASRWAVATNYYGVSHPSLPNYLALAAGSTFGVASDCVTCYITAPNLFGQLAAAGDSYDAFFEGVPSSCFLGPWGGTGYASKHNPFRYFNDVRTSNAICSHLQPMTRLAPLLRGPATATPQFVWVTPNLCNDGHDCPPTTAGAWLTRFVDEVTASRAWHDRGLLIVTWDESNASDAGLNNVGRVVASGGGGHVVTIVITSLARRGARSAVAYNHYSTLATIEDALGLPLLANARHATAMSAFFP